MLFVEPLKCDIPVVVKSDKQAYIVVAINEILHALGVIKENDYSIVYSILSDNEHLKLF